MATVILRYQVRTDRAAENIAFIQTVVAALQKAGPDSIRHTSMVADGGGAQHRRLPRFRLNTA